MTMKLKKTLQIILALCLGLWMISCQQEHIKLTSPNGKLSLEFTLDEEGAPRYCLRHAGKNILLPSRLGLVLKDAPDLLTGFVLKEVKHDSHNDVWQPVWGEEAEIVNHYNELRVCLKEKTSLERELNIIFRLFDDGMGFRYEFPRQQQLQEFLIDDEVTEFVFPADYDAWSIPVKGVRFYEALFEKKTLSKMGWVSTPVTIETTDSLYLAIHEANLTDYAAMNLKPVEQLEDNKTVTLRAALTPWSTGEKVRVTDTRVSPWRTMIVAESAGDLLLSRLMLNLNEPCRITDTSWIQPMRYIGIWWTYHMKHNTWHAGPHHGATTENTMRHIDFAAANNLGGVLVEGWNEDWATWKFSFTKPYTDFDIQRITDYGRSKGVALIGHHETGGNVSNYENQMEDGFKFYEKYGVHQVKTGYVGDLLDGKEYHSSQFGVLHYRKVIEAAARHRICIDNHEPVIPTGLQRTFPNLMTQEGVRGQEWDAWDVDGGNPPSHTVILPFTRGLAGPMDFTPVTFRFVNDVMPQTRVHTTLAKQLALFVVLYSPLQMASDEIENYEANPEPFNFIVSCPTDWSRTVVPEACIGSYVTIARCDKGEGCWYIGSITGDEERTANISLSFLDTDKSYLATIYRDAPESDYETCPAAILIEEREVTYSDTLTIRQARSGGTAVRLCPIKDC